MDKSGSAQEPHPQSLTKPEDRYFQLMHKSSTDFLSGPHLLAAGLNLETALRSRLERSSVTTEWIEMDDLYDFVRSFVSPATVQAMCGARFVERFPDFVEKFWKLNGQLPRFLEGWTRLFLPRAWDSREACISNLQEWRDIAQKDEQYNGHGMMTRRWQYFSKMEAFSSRAVACSDLGILWGFV